MTPQTRGYSEEDFALLSEIGGRIRKRRLELGYKGPTDLARAMGEDDQFGQYISSVERGMNGPRLLMLLKIAAGLKTTTAHLLGDAEAEHRDADEERFYKNGYRACLMDMQTGMTDLATKLRAENLE